MSQKTWIITMPGTVRNAYEFRTIITGSAEEFFGYKRSHKCLIRKQ